MALNHVVEGSSPSVGIFFCLFFLSFPLFLFLLSFPYLQIIFSANSHLLLPQIYCLSILFSFLFHQHTPTIKIYYKWHNIFTTTTPSLLDPLVHNVNGDPTQFMYRIRLTTKLVAISFFQKTHDFHQIINICKYITSCEVPNES